MIKVFSFYIYISVIFFFNFNQDKHPYVTSVVKNNNNNKEIYYKSTLFLGEISIFQKHNNTRFYNFFFYQYYF